METGCDNPVINRILKCRRHLLNFCSNTLSSLIFEPWEFLVFESFSISFPKSKSVKIEMKEIFGLNSKNTP